MGLQFDFGCQYCLVASLAQVHMGNAALGSPLLPRRTYAPANVFLKRRF